MSSTTTSSSTTTTAFPCDNWGTNQCAGGTPSASSVAGGFVAANAFDGNTGTCWYTAWGDIYFPCWIQYEFASPKQIHKFRIYCVTSFYGVENSSLLASNTGAFSGEEVTLFSGKDFSIMSEWQEIDFVNDLEYKYYRLYIPWYVSTSPRVVIQEIEMMECYDYTSTTSSSSTTTTTTTTTTA